MNPFKHKQIEEFTIADCELYISKYPYGEHLIEVKRFLKKLKIRYFLLETQYMVYSPLSSAIYSIKKFCTFKNVEIVDKYP